MINYEHNEIKIYFKQKKLFFSYLKEIKNGY